MNQPIVNFTPNDLPDASAAVQFLDGMVAHENRMIFAPQPKYQDVKKLALYQQYFECMGSDEEDQGFLIATAIRHGIRKLYNDFVPFTEEAATSVFFQPDRYIEFYGFLETRPDLDDRLTQNSFAICSCAWAKLQFVFAARHFNCNANVLRMLVASAWKTGHSQSIMTANFGPTISTSLFRASSSIGLNSFETAPSRTVGKTLFRGGGMDPRLSHGMAWTEDRDMDVFFATRLSSKVPVVLSTKTTDNEVLARFQHEDEVVLSYDPKRPFEVTFV